jgi:DNA-binding response OmpR family regulator
MDSNKKILIVDDEKTHLEYLETMLSKVGYIVETAEDGVQALDKVNKFRPDLIILDNIMPKMTGYEATKTLKSNPKFKEIPIIMLSALDDEKDMAACFDAGVDDYLIKPFNFSVVLIRINAVIRNRELFAQIAMRERRLVLAEELNKVLKEKLAEFAESINGIDNAMAAHSAANGNDPIGEQRQALRKQIASMDAHIEKTVNEWDNLKKDEIELSVLESQVRKSLHQEHQ